MLQRTQQPLPKKGDKPLLFWRHCVLLDTLRGTYGCTSYPKDETVLNKMSRMGLEPTLCCEVESSTLDLYSAKTLHRPIFSESSKPNGCVRLASLGRPRCMAVFSPRTNVCNYLHTFVLEKKTVTHRGRPREAKRTHPI